VAHYEVVAVKSTKGGADYVSTDSIQDAKSEIKRLAETGYYEQVFVRQYRRYRSTSDERYRILHTLTWRRQAV